MRPPEVSVVIPLFNKAPHIARAVESVLKQSVRGLEIVVVDDGSTDDGAEVVRGMGDDRIRLIRQRNGGAASARNKGIEESRGELIALLDADDAWEPLFLETILRLGKSFPDAGAYATAYRVRDRGARERAEDYDGIPAAPWEGIVPDYFATATKSRLIWTSAVAIPRRVFSDVGGFAESEATGEDLEMWFRIALKYPIAFSRYIGSTWHRDSTNRICETVPIPADPLILTSIGRSLRGGAVGPQLSRKLRRYHDSLAAMFAKTSLLQGRRRNARHILNRRFERRVESLYLLTFLPDAAVRSLIALNRRLKGLRAEGAPDGRL